MESIIISWQQQKLELQLSCSKTSGGYNKGLSMSWREFRQQSMWSWCWVTRMVQQSFHLRPEFPRLKDGPKDAQIQSLSGSLFLFREQCHCTGLSFAFFTTLGETYRDQHQYYNKWEKKKKKNNPKYIFSPYFPLVPWA